MWYLEQGAEISAPCTYNTEDIFRLFSTYNVVKIPTEFQWATLSSLLRLLFLYKYYFHAKTYRARQRISCHILQPSVKELGILLDMTCCKLLPVVYTCKLNLSRQAVIHTHPQKNKWIWTGTHHMSKEMNKCLIYSKWQILSTIYHYNISCHVNQHKNLQSIMSNCLRRFLTDQDNEKHFKKF